MTESTAFASSGQEAITRSLHIELDKSAANLSWDEFADYYEIDRTIDEIVGGDYKRIALQFPDELLNDSVPIFRALKAKVGDERDLYVLADTSYGSCCVDEVAAQHVDADAMVHYGHACMSQTSRLPVIYVFGKKAVDVEHCVTEFSRSLQEASTETLVKAVLFKHQVAYSHKAEQLLSQLRKSLPLEVKLFYMPISTKTEPVQQPARTATDVQFPHLYGESRSEGDIPPENSTILYLGGESLAFTNLLITHGSSQVYRYDPETKRAGLESFKTNKLLMKRYAVVQKARDADVFGILVGTLGVASYLPLISHLRKLLAKAQKKSYTISVGKLNPAKLGNFMEIECFVLVACPENSLIDAKDFFRPIVTPFELEIALKADRSWTGRYVLSFEQLLAEHENNEAVTEAETSDNEDDPDRPIFSLVTGQYRKAKKYGGADPPNVNVDGESSLAVVPRNGDGTVARLADSPAAEFLQNRSFQGLETRIGRDMPSVLEQGRTGIAKGYEDDRH